MILLLLLLLLASKQEVDKCSVIVVLDGKKEIGIIIMWPRVEEVTAKDHGATTTPDSLLQLSPRSAMKKTRSNGRQSFIFNSRALYNKEQR